MSPVEATGNSRANAPPAKAARANATSPNPSRPGPQCARGAANRLAPLRKFTASRAGRLEVDLEREPMCARKIRQIRVRVIEVGLRRQRSREVDARSGRERLDVVAEVVPAAQE